MYLIFDTETTGLPRNWKAPLTDADNWPRCIQIAWQLHDEKGHCIAHEDYLILPVGFTIPYDSEKIHGISTALAEKNGIPLVEVLERFQVALKQCEFVGGHNVSFDLNIMGAEFLRLQDTNPLEALPIIDTCTEETAALCRLPGGRGGKFKLPTLGELYAHLFGTDFAEAHNATADVEATARCFFELFRKRQILPASIKDRADLLQIFEAALEAPVELIGLKHQNLKSAAARLAQQTSEAQQTLVPDFPLEQEALADAPFVHLHTHSQYSVLQSTSSIADIVNAAANDRMPAVTLTDHANLMGAFHFIKAVKKHNDSLEEGQPPLKPILGWEFFCL